MVGGSARKVHRLGLENEILELGYLDTFQLTGPEIKVNQENIKEYYYSQKERLLYFKFERKRSEGGNFIDSVTLILPSIDDNKITILNNELKIKQGTDPVEHYLKKSGISEIPTSSEFTKFLSNQVKREDDSDDDW